MAQNRDIRTSLKLDGEAEFRKALRATQQELKVLDSELKLAASEFQATGDATKMYANVTSALKAKLEQQQQAVALLEEQLEKAKKTFGDNSEEARNYQIALNKAKQAMNKTIIESKKLEDQMDDAGEMAKGLGEQLKDALADGAKAAESDLERLQKTLDDLKNMGAIKIGIELAEKAWEAATALVDFVNEQREVVRQQSIMDYQAVSAGYDPNMIQSMVMQAASITGDYEGAQSAYGMMLNLPGMSQEWLRAWSDMMLGADIAFSDLDFASLMSDLQETLSSREFAGSFLNLLQRSSIGEAKMAEASEKLKNAATLEEAMGTVMTLLAGVEAVRHEDGTTGSYADYLRGYMAEEQELIAAEQANLELKQAMADLAETLQPITTWLTEVATGFVTSFNTFLGWFEAFLGDKGVVADTTVTESVAQEAAYLTMAATGQTPEQLKTATAAEIEAIKQDGIVDFALQTWEKQDQAVDNWLSETWNSLVSLPGKLADAYVSWENSLFQGFDPKTDKQYEHAIGPALPPGYLQDVTDELDDAASDAATSGSSIASNLAAGISQSAPLVAAEAQAVVDSINGIFGSVSYPTFRISGSTGGTIPVSMPNVAVNLDGRRVGQLITPHVSRQQGRLSNG